MGLVQYGESMESDKRQGQEVLIDSEFPGDELSERSWLEG